VDVVRQYRKLFQPTRPRGARRSKADKKFYTHSFNPRAHEGRDSMEAINRIMGVFQPTRPRGARLNAAFYH